jgi:hypothetical protein
MLEPSGRWITLLTMGSMKSPKKIVQEDRPRKPSKKTIQ